MTENKKYSLRMRLAVAMVLVVLFATSLFAVVFYFINEKLEMNVLSILLNEEMEHLKFRHAQGQLDEALFQSPILSVYMEGNANVPAPLTGLGPGEYHDFWIGGRSYHVLVEKIEDRRIYLLYDITHVEYLARVLMLLLFIAVVLLSALSAWISFAVAKQLVGPVDRLAARVSRLDPRQRAIRLAPDFSGNEVEVIARAFDRFMERLDGFVEREQMFTAAASHELRTPLAVIQGATELLAGQVEPGSSAARAVARIDRARAEMSEFIQALLSLAREEFANSEFAPRTRLQPLLAALCEDYQGLLSGPVSLDLECREDPVVDMPPALVTVIVGNLLRNAVEHTRRGRISLYCAGKTLSIRDTGEGMTAQQLESFRSGLPESGGRRGLGLRLVRCLCERYSWQFNINSTPGKGTTVVITFRTAG